MRVFLSEKLRTRKNAEDRFFNSAELLNDYTSNVIRDFDQKGVSYQAFIKLSYLYTLHFDFLEGHVSDRPEVFASRGQIEQYFSHPIILLRSSELSRIVLNWTNSHVRQGAPYVFIPTTANIGLDSMMLALSLDAGFLAVHPYPEMVDGGLQNPSELFEHDLAHSEFPKKFAQDGKLWRRLRSELRLLKTKNIRQYDIQLAILFNLVHEDDTQLNCGESNGLERFFDTSVEQVENDSERSQAKWKLKTLHRRLLSEEDLGQMFKSEPVRMSEPGDLRKRK